MKKLLFTLAIGLVTLVSCESDLVSAPPNDSVGGGILLTKIVGVYNGVSVTTDLTYDGNKLVQISDDDGSSDTFVYANELLTQQTHTWNGGSIVETFEYDSSNRLEKIYQGGDLAYTYTYNADGTISKTENPGGSVAVSTYTNGNLVSETYTNGSVSSVTTYTYDTKNNPFTNIHQTDVFALLGYHNANNILVSATTGTAADSYDNSTTVYNSYNSSNFPVESSSIAAPGTPDEETSTAQYFYE